MNRISTLLRESLRARRAGFLACALALGCAGGAHAAAVSVIASYAMPGTGLVIEPAQNAPSATYPSNVDILTFTGDGGGNNIGIHTYGDVGGSNLGNRVSGDNTFGVSGLMRYTTSASGSFNFNIIPGEVGANGSASFSSAEGQHAWIRFLIQAVDTSLAGPVTIFDAMAEARVGFGQGDIASCDAILNCNITSLPGEGVQIFLGGGSYSLDLDSLLGAGTHDLVYDITAFAEGSVLPANLGSCVSPPYPGGGGGEIGATFAAAVVEGGGNGGFAATCSAIARSGDPLPLPGTVYLLGVGIAGLAMARRRKV